MGCTAPQMENMAFIFDQTEMHKALNTEHLINSVNIDFGNVLITEIINQSLSKDAIVFKEQSPFYLFQKYGEELQKDKDFQNDLRIGFDQYNRDTEGLDESFVFPTLARVCKDFSHSKSDIIVFSDLFHHENNGFSFYAYKNNPDELMVDYSIIVKALEREYLALTDGVDLSGISIHVIYYPSRENDRLYREVRKFWHRYFSEKNAQIEFATSLNNKIKLRKS